MIGRTNPGAYVSDAELTVQIAETGLLSRCSQYACGLSLSFAATCINIA